MIPLLGFTYLCFINSLLQLRENFYRIIWGEVNLGEGLPQKCSCTVFGNNRHDSNVLGKKSLISTYSEYIFVIIVCSCLLHIIKPLFLESFQLPKYQRIPHSDVKLNRFLYIIPKLKFTRILTLRNEIEHQQHLEKINNDFMDYLYYIDKIFYFSFLGHMTSYFNNIIYVFNRGLRGGQDKFGG